MLGPDLQTKMLCNIMERLGPCDSLVLQTGFTKFSSQEFLGTIVKVQELPKLPLKNCGIQNSLRKGE